MAREFFVSSNVVFGKDAVKKLPDMLKEYGAKSVMVVYDAGVKMAGIAEKVLAEVEKADTKVTVFDGVIPNPTNEVVEEAALLAQKEEIDVFVAVGGGSSIDLTKAVNILMTNPGPIGQYGGIGLVKNQVLPLIAIPTTAGTSSEITNVVALTDTKAVCKYVIIDNKIVADKAEALEFRVKEGSPLLGIPLERLQLKNNLLVACINRSGCIITPRGKDTIEAGDTVIIVTTHTGLNDLTDILK